MPRKREEPEATIFEQTPDQHGRIRLDRPLTGTEAQEQNEQNRERYVEQRRKRFQGRKEGSPTNG